MNNRLTILIGLPASGKTTYTKNLYYDEQTIVLSSDSIREELFGYRNQEQNGLVFETMNKRCKKALKDGFHVVYDATNINRKRRKALINEMRKYCISVTSMCFVCDFNTILERNKCRNKEEQIPEEDLLKMLKNFQVPLFEEGYDKIIFKNSGINNTIVNINRFFSGGEIKDICDLIKLIPPDLMDYNQHNEHHNETLGNHIKTTIEECFINSGGQIDYDGIILMISAFYHDIGKPYCREIKEDGNATYRNHNLVSSYIALCDYVYSFLLDTVWLIDIGNYALLDIIQLIELHDFIFSYKDLDEAKEKLVPKIGTRLWGLLDILHKADKYRPEQNN